MSEKPTPEWQRAIETYREGYRQLVQLGIHLIKTNQDLTAMKEVVHGMTESQAKEMLVTALAGDAVQWSDTRRDAKLN